MVCRAVLATSESTKDVGPRGRGGWRRACGRSPHGWAWREYGRFQIGNGTARTDPAAQLKTINGATTEAVSERSRRLEARARKESARVGVARVRPVPDRERDSAYRPCRSTQND